MNFDNIEDNKDQVRVRKTLSPSVQILTVEEAEFKNNVNMKEYLALKLVNADGQYMKPQIYVTTNSGWARVKELATALGNPLVGDLTNDQIIGKLLGGKATFIIDGEIELANIDGNDVKVTRPVLRFSHFAFPTAELAQHNGEFRIKDKTSEGTTSDSPFVPVESGDVNDLPF